MNLALIPVVGIFCLPQAGSPAGSAARSSNKGVPMSVRVQFAGGAPRLVVGGKPVRARMFFGGAGNNPIHVGPERRRVEFEFIADADSEGRGTIHFRFGHFPGTVLLDDIEVVEAAAGRPVLPRCTFEGGMADFEKGWRIWPEGERNTVGKVDVVEAQNAMALRVRLNSPPGGEWPDFHIYSLPQMDIRRGQKYRVSFTVYADPARDLFVNLYRPGNPFVRLGGPSDAFEKQIRLAAGAGVNFVTFIVPTPWPAPGEAEDWSAVDLECDRVLAANPNALLLPRFGLDPPAWWAQAHPDHMMVWENGSRRHTAVPASPLYRREAARRAAALVRHLEERYGDRMAGYHPCGQNTGEWFYEETWGQLLNGYAPADLEGFRAWLRQHYATDEALKVAWRDPQVTLATATVPTPAERRTSPAGVLRNPAAERKLVDFAAYQQDAMADLVIELAKAVREASRGRKLVVFFYGYAYEFGGVVLGPATCGHYAMRRVLQCPDIDILCSPISYGDRGLAQSGPVMSAAESVPLTGDKMWLQEDDTRTHCSPDEPDAIARTHNPWETEQVLTRNVVNEATRNMATWWMDLGMTGWFNDPGIWHLMRRLKPLDDIFLRNPAPYRPEVASVMHERSMLLVGPFVHDVTGPIIYAGRHALGRLGAPYGQYLLDDVLAGKVQARMYVFHNAWWLNESERKTLRRRTRGAAKVWCYAPGMYEDAGPSPAAMKELTGFELVQVSPDKARVTPTAAGKKAGLEEEWGLERAVTPLFAARDAKPEETLAVYPDGSAAVALRKMPDGWSLFVGVPALTPALLRVAARAGGVHLYAEDDTCIWANGPVVAAQAVRDGTVRLRLPASRSVTDLLTGKPVARGASLALPMKRGEIRVLRLQ